MSKTPEMKVEKIYIRTYICVQKTLTIEMFVEHTKIKIINEICNMPNIQHSNIVNQNK